VGLKHKQKSAQSWGLRPQSYDKTGLGLGLILLGLVSNTVVRRPLHCKEVDE